MVQNQRNGTGLIPLFLILYYTYLKDKINTIFRFFVFLLKFYHIENTPLTFYETCFLMIFLLH